MKNLGNPLGSYKWFIGQVPPNQNQHLKTTTWNDAHGDRVKVRIPSMHPMSGSDAVLLSDDDLPWAIVAKPTTHGNRNNQSTGIWGGEWVIGFFMDEECQIPVITQVLGNNLHGEIRESTNGNTLGKRVKRYTSGNPANNAQILAPSVRKSKGEIDPKSFDAAKKQKQPEGALENLTTEQEATTEDPLALAEFTGDEVPTGESSNQSFGKGLSPDRALQRAENDIGSLIVIPGGVPVNANPTESQLQQMKSNGFTYYPAEQGQGGKFIHTNQNFA